MIRKLFNSSGKWEISLSDYPNFGWGMYKCFVVSASTPEEAYMLIWGNDHIYYGIDDHIVETWNIIYLGEDTTNLGTRMICSDNKGS